MIWWVYTVDAWCITNQSGYDRSFSLRWSKGGRRSPRNFVLLNRPFKMIVACSLFNAFPVRLSLVNVVFVSLSNVASASQPALLIRLSGKWSSSRILYPLMAPTIGNRCSSLILQRLNSDRFEIHAFHQGIDDDSMFSISQTCIWHIQARNMLVIFLIRL